MIPSTRDVIDRVIADYRSETHTAFPARVIAYDAGAQTVDVSPALMREVPSDDPASPWGFEALPDLANVPLMSLRGGGYAVTFPLKPGDWVLVVCAEQSTLVWRRTGAVPAHPGYIDPFGLNGCVAIPGWAPDAERLRNVSTSDLVLGTEDGATSVSVGPTSVWLGAKLGASPLALAQGVQSAMTALATSLEAAGANPATAPTTAPVLTALASIVRTWAGTVATTVGATKARGV